MASRRRIPRGVEEAAIAALALSAAAGSLLNAFTGDDHWIVEHNDRVHHLAGAWRLLAQTYWPPQNGAALYRPIPMLGFAVEWVVGGGAPWVVHACGTVLYAGVALAVLWLARLVLGRGAGWVAAAFFAVQPIHAEVTSNAVGQAELWAAWWTVVGVALYIGWRRDGKPWSAARVAALTAVYGAACLSKESGVTLPLVLAVAECTVVSRQPAAWPVRLRAVWPVAVALAGAGVAYIGIRWRVVGSLAGDYPTFAFAHAPALTRWLTMLGATPTIAELVFWPGRIAVEYMPQAVILRSRPDAGLIGPTLILLALSLVTWRVRRVWPAVTFGLLWIGVALLPVSNLLIPAGVILAPRTLFLPSVGAALAIGAALQGIWMWVRSSGIGQPTSGTARRSFVPALGLLCLAALLTHGVWRSLRRAAAWRDDLTLVTQTAADVPESYLARDGYGRALFELGQPAAGERELRQAIALYPGDPGPYVHLASAYERSAMCQQAVALYRQALTLLPTRPDARIGLGRCLWRLGDYDGAVAEARIGLSYGFEVAAFHRLEAQADSARSASSAPRSPRRSARVPPGAVHASGLG